MNLIKKILIVTLITLMIIFLQINISNAASVKITTETLNLRKEASTDSDIVAQISEGIECELIEEDGDWYKVKYEDYTGYISKEYAELIGSTDKEKENNNISEENAVDVDNTVTEETTVEENALTGEGTINKATDLRIVPLVSSTVIDSLKSGDTVTVINQINGWSYIYTDELSGWIRSDNITLKGQNRTENKDTDTKSDNKDSDDKEKNSEDDKNTKFEEQTMYTNDSYVNLRKEPSTNSDIIMVVEQNTKLNVIGEEGDWYKVNTSQGEAYVSKELLSSEKKTVTSRSSTTKEKYEAEASKASTSNSVKGTKIVSYAKKFIGVPYVYGGASPSGFDCSGFTMYVYKNFGISIPHGAQGQAKLGKKVSTNKSSKSSLLNNLKAGDLVFFLDYETMDEIGHCGIYIGNGNFIHASSGSGYCVKINSLLPGEYYNTRYCGARRII